MLHGHNKIERNVRFSEKSGRDRLQVPRQGAGLMPEIHQPHEQGVGEQAVYRALAVDGKESLHNAAKM